MKWIGQLASLLVVAVVVGVGVFLFARVGGGGDTTIVSVDQIKKVAQLATIDYHLSVAEYHEKKPVGLEWLSAKVFVSVRGHIEGSVDMKLAKITVPKEGEEQRVKIMFPKGAVIVSDPKIGPDDIQFMTCADPNPFHKLNDKDFQAAQKHAIATLIKVAKDDGIRAKTASEAKSVLESFLAALGLEADVTFEEEELNVALAQ